MKTGAAETRGYLDILESLIGFATVSRDPNRELLAYVDYREGNVKDAQAAYEALAKDTTTPVGIRERAAGMAAFLGVFMIWGVGFSHIAAAHNAAHDVRHSNGFPCH